MPKSNDPFEFIVPKIQTNIINMCKNCKHFKGIKQNPKYPNTVIILCGVSPKEWYGDMKCLGERTLRVYGR